MTWKVRPFFPGWQLLSKFGATIVVRLDVVQDSETGLYHGSSRDLFDLRVEAKSIEELQSEFHAAVSEFLEAGCRRAIPPTHTEMTIYSTLPIAT